MLFYDLVTDWEWTERPHSYGWFHIASLIIMVLVCTLSVLFLAKKHNKKIDDIFVFCVGIILVVLEIYKQFFYVIVKGYYCWEKFPFQFCSLPIYLSFIAPLIKNDKIKDVIYRFLASYCLLVGLCIMIYPETCLSTPYIVMSIHTMIWHLLIVVLGVYLIVSKCYGKNIKELFSPFVMFSVFATIAVIANIVSYNLFFGDVYKNIHKDKFMLFYISPYYDLPLEVLTSIRDAVGFPVYFILYLFGFFLGVLSIWGFLALLRKISLKVSAKFLKY